MGGDAGLQVGSALGFFDVSGGNLESIPTGSVITQISPGEKDTASYIKRIKKYWRDKKSVVFHLPTNWGWGTAVFANPWFLFFAASKGLCFGGGFCICHGKICCQPGTGDGEIAPRSGQLSSSQGGKRCLIFNLHKVSWDCQSSSKGSLTSLEGLLRIYLASFHARKAI